MSYQRPEIDIEGFVSGDELDWLYEMACKMDSIVEVGCWRGKSTHALASGCKGIVWAVDHWQGSPSERGGAHRLATEKDVHAMFLENVGHMPNIEVLKMDSVEAAKLFKDRSVDMVWIDGGHDYNSIWNDLNAWWPKVKKILCGHDIGQDGVPSALQKFGIPHRREHTGMWVIEREIV